MNPWKSLAEQIMTKIKICGITNVDDARLAVELGADALGFVFYPKSPRSIKVRDAANICNGLPPFVARVGVFVNELEYEIEKALGECLLTALQFHGDEPPGFCQKFAAKSIKAIRMRDESSLRAAAEYDVDALLLDTYTDESRGGTGRTFDWSLAVKAKELGPPIILSGGLTAANVQGAIRAVRPYGVDVSSGVEREPGKKDPEKLRRFIELCKSR
jgi:phosphoribosylanthranilate isomerase